MGNLIGNGGSGLPGGSFGSGGGGGDDGGIIKVIGFGALAAGALFIKTCNFSSGDDAARRALKNLESNKWEHKTPPPNNGTTHPHFEWPKEPPREEGNELSEEAKDLAKDAAGDVAEELLTPDDTTNEKQKLLRSWQ